MLLPPIPTICLAWNPLNPGIGIIGLEASYIIPIFLRLTVARKWFKKVRGWWRAGWLIVHATEGGWLAPGELFLLA